MAGLTDKSHTRFACLPNGGEEEAALVLEWLRNEADPWAGMRAVPATKCQGVDRGPEAGRRLWRAP